MFETKRKLAFIDHSYRQKTHANEFLRKLLSRRFDLDNFWDHCWQGGKGLVLDDLNKRNFEKIIFFQSLPRAETLKKLRCQEFIWFPMYDQEAGRKNTYYIPYLRFNLKIISFSQVLAKRFASLGFDCSYYQYFPRPVQDSKQSKGMNVLFWLRTQDVSWSIVKELLGDNPMNALILKLTPDPFQKITLPAHEELKRYKVKLVDKWLTQEKYFKLLSLCDVFIAPRKREGIGLSFLEAMARGKCVLAPDQPTMNEYIKHGKTGYLYDLGDPQSFDLKDYQRVGQRAWDAIRAGRKRWEQNRERILEELEGPFARISVGKRARLALVYYSRDFFYNMALPCKRLLSQSRRPQRKP